MRLAALLIVWLASGHLATAAAGEAVGFALPSRASGRPVVRARQVAQAIAGQGVARAPVVLDRELERAQELFRAASLDEAAVILDAALAEGRRAVSHLADPAAFAEAHITRALIALVSRP